MTVATVYRGNDRDAAEGIAHGLERAGERVVASSWFGECFVYRFDGMSEEQIDAWLDREFDRLDALRSVGIRA